MEIYRRYGKFVKVSGIVLITTGVGWTIAQINKTFRNLNSILDTDVINITEPAKYPDAPIIEEPIAFDYLKNYDGDDEESMRKSWNSLKFAYARRLLHMTTSENPSVRIKAVKRVTEIHTLENWHYSLLAHCIDPKTAVGLARHRTADPRFFVKPALPYFSHSHEMIVDRMKEFLIALNNCSDHSCLAYFINKAFFDQDTERFIDHDSVLRELRNLIKSANDILPLCLESILHHSYIKTYAKDIVLFNGLSLLMDVHRRFINNVDVSITLCNILSNISNHPELLEEVYRTGWISVLAKWVNHPNLLISAPAARALANLDQDDQFHATYSRRIYVLHPMYREDQKTAVDVIFVHGLLGGVFYTWRQRDKSETTLGFLGKMRRFLESITSENTFRNFRKSSDPVLREYIEDFEEHQEREWDFLGSDFEFVLNDIPISSNTEASGPYTCTGDHDCIQDKNNADNYSNCWPKDWLANDCKNIRILGINYDTNLSMWTPMCPDMQLKMSLEERSDIFLSKLVQAGVGQRPVVWITHSMGGLLIKSILCKAWESKDPQIKKICSSTKGLMFYSTPHQGSPLATINQATSLVLWPSVEVQELREQSPMLLDLHERFLRMLNKHPIKIVSFVETKMTMVTALKFNLLFVTPNSANPLVGEFFEVPQDHLGICKPANKQSFLYQKVLTLVQELVDEYCDKCT